MHSAAYMKRLATAVAGAALASALAVSGASANYGSQPVSSPEVAPPPSSIAASAAEQYEDLRSPDAVDAARAAGDPPDVTNTPQNGLEPVGVGQQDLRSPDTRDQAEGYRPTLEPQPVADEPSEPTGFDLVSAAIGAVAAGGLSLVLMATLGMRRLPGRRAASA
jgi:hypothetical protein